MFSIVSAALVAALAISASSASRISMVCETAVGPVGNQFPNPPPVLSKDSSTLFFRGATDSSSFQSGENPYLYAVDSSNCSIVWSFNVSATFDSDVFTILKVTEVASSASAIGIVFGRPNYGTTSAKVTTIAHPPKRHFASIDVRTGKLNFAIFNSGKAFVGDAIATEHGDLFAVTSESGIEYLHPKSGNRTASCSTDAFGRLAVGAPGTDTVLHLPSQTHAVKVWKQGTHVANVPMPGPGYTTTGFATSPSGVLVLLGGMNPNIPGPFGPFAIGFNAVVNTTNQSTVSVLPLVFNASAGTMNMVSNDYQGDPVFSGPAGTFSFISAVTPQLCNLSTGAVLWTTNAGSYTVHSSLGYFDAKYALAVFGAEPTYLNVLEWANGGQVSKMQITANNSVIAGSQPLTIHSTNASTGALSSGRRVVLLRYGFIGQGSLLILKQH